MRPPWQDRRLCAYRGDVPDVAFIASGKLRLARAGSPPVEIESQFASQVAARATRLAEKNEWKRQGAGARFMMGLGGAPDPEALVGRADAVPPVFFTGVSRGRRPGELVYALSTGAVCGLFAYDVATGEETRLWHQASPRIDDPVVRPRGAWIACRVAVPGGGSHIGVMRDDGTDLLEITEGDVMDEGPAWVPGDGKQVVYASRGIARDAAGLLRGLGPAVVCRLDPDRGTVEPLVEDPTWSYQAPQVAADGTLWCLRLPYRVAPSPSLWRTLADVVLLPWHLVRAVGGWLNFFSLRFTGKPLMSSGSAAARRADMRRALVAGQLLDAAAAAGEAEDVWRADGSWQLVRVARGAAPEVAHKGVACFDLGDEGTLAWSDGHGVYLRDAAGRDTRVGSGRRVEQVVLLR